MALASVASPMPVTPNVGREHWVLQSLPSVLCTRPWVCVLFKQRHETSCVRLAAEPLITALQAGGPALVIQPATYVAPVLTEQTEFAKFRAGTWKYASCRGLELVARSADASHTDWQV